MSPSRRIRNTASATSSMPPVRRSRCPPAPDAPDRNARCRDLKKSSDDDTLILREKDGCRMKSYAQDCPVANTLDLIGDRWTLLIVRDLFLGRTRFAEFQQSLAGIPTNLLG